MADLKALVLIPAYNEASRIAAVVRGVRALGFDVLVSDDGSDDATADESRRAGAEVLRVETNGGKGAAMRRGFRYFLARPYDAVILMDADGQHDPRDIAGLLAALSDAEVVIGDRMRATAGMPWLRVATNRFMSWIVSRAAGRRIPDSQCGFRALKRRAIERMDLRTDRFEIESEILLEAARTGCRVASAPISSVYAGQGSHIRPVRDTVRFIAFLSNYLLDRKRRRP